jgi:TolB protein
MKKRKGLGRPVPCGLLAGALLFGCGLGVSVPGLRSSEKGVLAYCYQVVSGGDTKSLYRINEDGTDNSPLGAFPVNVNAPKWSPDGTKIALYGYPTDSTWSIYLMNADGTGFARLTNTENVWDSLPRWSPDGARIVFTRSYPKRRGREEIWVMDSGGGGQTWTGILGGGADWSPDGSRFVYHSNKGTNYDLYVSQKDGTDKVRLTTSSGMDVHPRWSPDGKKIAFSSNRDGDFNIYIINADGSGLFRLTDYRADEFSPVWSPEGTRIAFESNLSDPAADHSEIYVIDITGTNLRRVTHTPPQATAIQPDWRPR